MAICQYTFVMIPQADLTALGAKSAISPSDYQNFDFWNDEKYKMDFFRTLVMELPQAALWSATIATYGQEDSNCIYFVIDQEQVVEVSVRLDFRKDFNHLLNTFIDFCRLNSCVLLDENLCILPLNDRMVREIIFSSPQYCQFNGFQMTVN